MKDTRKLSVIYFMISLVMLLMVAFGCERAIDDDYLHTFNGYNGCERAIDVDYLHTFNGYNVYYAKTDNPEYIERYAKHLKESIDNFIIQSDFGIIEVEDGEIIYNNIK